MFHRVRHRSASRRAARRDRGQTVAPAPLNRRKGAAVLLAATVWNAAPSTAGQSAMGICAGAPATVTGGADHSSSATPKPPCVPTQMPLASSAESTVSPSYPSTRTPLTVKRMGLVRSISGLANSGGTLAASLLELAHGATPPRFRPPSTAHLPARACCTIPPQSRAPAHDVAGDDRGQRDIERAKPATI